MTTRSAWVSGVHISEDSMGKKAGKAVWVGPDLYDGPFDQAVRQTSLEAEYRRMTFNAMREALERPDAHFL